MFCWRCGSGKIGLKQSLEAIARIGIRCTLLTNVNRLQGWAIVKPKSNRLSRCNHLKLAAISELNSTPLSSKVCESERREDECEQRDHVERCQSGASGCMPC